MRNLTFRPIAAALTIVFLTGVPTIAGPVVVTDVVQTLSSYQNPPDLRMRSVSQHSTAVSADIRSNVVQLDANNSAGGSRSAALFGGARDGSLLGLVTVPNTNQDVAVDIIDAGDVQGAVCDCGEIPVKDGGLPWWPVLFVAVVPFFFIHDCDDCLTPTPTGTPTPLPVPSPTVFCVNCTPSEVPEPASLILFGSGLVTLGAGLRRRYAKAKLTSQIKASKEG